MTGLFPPLKNETRQILNRLPVIIDKAFPLPARFHAALPRNVAELSRLLTFEREDRSASYLGKPALLSAYLRYFLPWNIYRLSRLLASLPLELKPDDAINDLGAGPLTLAASLWVSRPEFRKIPLEFRCVDRTAAVLEAGKQFFHALAAATTESSECPWTVKTIKGELKRNGALSVEIKGKPATLCTALNVYNELFWSFSPFDTEKIERFAEDQARLLLSLIESSGSILVVEPGIPRSGEFISLLRSNFIKKGSISLSPCTHQAPCPLPGSKTGTGGKNKWSHFAFDTKDAPDLLHKLSAAAKIPKERAVLSFILAGKNSALKQTANLDQPELPVRIISDSFSVPGLKENNADKVNWGRYGCSKNGLVLVKGSKESLETSPSGSLEELSLINGLIDKKSGALIAVKK